MKRETLTNTTKTSVQIGKLHEVIFHRYRKDGKYHLIIEFSGEIANGSRKIKDDDTELVIGVKDIWDYSDAQLHAVFEFLTRLQLPITLCTEHKDCPDFTLIKKKEEVIPVELPIPKKYDPFRYQEYWNHKFKKQRKQLYGNEK
jgi:hypothetical protein